MTYDVFDIASYIINHCDKNNIKISNLKLQKLLYFIQALFIVYRGTTCFDSRMEAWDYGPVVPEVYNRYKVHGSMGIPSNGNDDFLQIDVEDKNIINELLDDIADMDAFQLVDITHSQDPWKESYSSVDRTITPDQIERYFSKHG